MTLILQQRPAHEFTRPPRSIRSHLSYWKASEFRSWLLVLFSSPSYKLSSSTIFPSFCLVVCSMHLLLQKRVSRSMCNTAEEMLKDFYDLVPELYGLSMCTMNVHSLIHLPYYVKILGLLDSAFSNCCFRFPYTHYNMSPAF